MTSITDPATTPYELWPMEYFLRSNFRDNITMTTTYQTVVNDSLDDSEMRRGLRSLPQISISMPYTMFDNQWRLHAQMSRQGVGKTLVPLWPESVILGPVIDQREGLYSGATVVVYGGYGPLALGGVGLTRRYATGSRVVLWNGTDHSVATITDLEILEGSGVALTLDVNVTSTFGFDILRMFPLIEAEIVYSSSLQLLTSTVSEGVVEYSGVGSSLLQYETDPGEPKEVPGGSELAMYSFYDDKPIFMSPIDWDAGVFVTYTRSGQVSASGVDSIHSVHGSRPRVGYQFTVRTLSRAQATDFRRLFDYCLGRCFPFFMRSPIADLEILGVAGTTVAVAGDGDIYDWNWRPYLAITANDGTVEVRKVVSVVSSVGVHSVTVDTAFTILNADVRNLRVARLVRFASDELIENWSTTETCDFIVELVEVTNEEDVTISRPGGYSSDLESPNATPLSDTWSPDGCSTVL